MSPNKTLLIGGNGQVGNALIEMVAKNHPLTAADLDSTSLPPGGLTCDLSKPDQIFELLNNEQPDIIINAAAYTAVDKAEEEQDLAQQINCNALESLGKFVAAQPHRFIIHYSTDYVFDGSGNEARTEAAPTNPLSVYGRSKLAGENVLRTLCPSQHAIFRTSWVFSDHGHNFVKTMLRLGSEREALKIVADQIGAPTSARLLAEATWHTLNFQDGKVLKGNPGLYHLTCKGETSWHGFAEAIFEGARRRQMELKVSTVTPIPSEDYPVPAPRPRNSRLNCSKFETTFHYRLPPWEDELSKTLDRLIAK